MPIYYRAFNFIGLISIYHQISLNIHNYIQPNVFPMNQKKKRLIGFNSSFSFLFSLCHNLLFHMTSRFALFFFTQKSKFKREGEVWGKKKGKKAIIILGVRGKWEIMNCLRGLKVQIEIEVENVRRRL